MRVRERREKRLVVQGNVAARRTKLRHVGPVGILLVAQQGLARWKEMATSIPYKGHKGSKVNADVLKRCASM